MSLTVKILLKKLKSHKFDDRTMDWIKTYLTKRRQRIVDNTANSSFQQVKSGVPQGLVLGSVLFLIFINDTPLYINEAYAEIYADNTTVHTSDKDQTVVQVKLQNSSTDFKCCIIHKLFVNLTITSSMSIGSRQNLSNSDDFFIIIDNEDISNVGNQNLLGIIIDKTLSWDKQIDSVCLNITRRITLLKLLSKYVDMPNLKLIMVHIFYLFSIMGA